MSPSLVDINANQPNVLTSEDFQTQVRSKRNELLLKSDWTMLIDIPITREKREEWAVYRQQLRDLPASATPDNIIWPSIPV